MRTLSSERIPGCSEKFSIWFPGSSPCPLSSLCCRLLCPLGSLPGQPMGGPGRRRQRLKVFLPPAWLMSHVCPSLCPSVKQCLIDSLPTSLPWFIPHPAALRMCFLSVSLLPWDLFLWSLVRDHRADHVLGLGCLRFLPRAYTISPSHPFILRLH